MVLQGSVLAKKTDGDWSRALPVTYVLVTCDLRTCVLARKTDGDWSTDLPVTHVLVTLPILLSDAQQAVIQRCGTVDDGQTVNRV